MNPDSLADGMMDRWKDYKARDALEKFWSRTAPKGTPFNEADAVAAALTLLDCYGAALRKIAEKGGTEVAIANEALTYRPPVWSKT